MLHRGVPGVKNTTSSGIWALACTFVLIGCGDGDHLSRSAERATPGGGVSGDPIAESLTVFAVDADSSRPLPEASVRLGAGAGARVVGHTGSDGRLKISGLGGEPQ